MTEWNEAAESAKKRLAKTLNRSAGQHMAAIRRAFAAARKGAAA